MRNKQIVDSSFSAIINAPIEKIDIPAWCLSIPEKEYQGIVIGLVAHTCIKATVRFATELGYDVTVVRDAVADYSDEMMHAALEINMPNYANAIVSTKDVLEASSAARGAVGA